MLERLCKARWTSVETALVLLAVVFLFGTVYYFGRPWGGERRTIESSRSLNPGLEIQSGWTGKRARTEYLDIREKAGGRSARIPSAFAAGRRLQFVSCPSTLPAPPDVHNANCLRWSDGWGETTALCFEHDDFDRVSNFYSSLDMPGWRAAHQLDRHTVVVLMSEKR